MNEHDLIESLKADLSSLARGNDAGLDKLRRRTELAIRKLFGDKSTYLHDLKQISFYPLLGPSDEEWSARAWATGTGSLRNLLETMAEDLMLARSSPAAAVPTGAAPTISDRVFIVHGKDEEMKQAVARTIEKLGIRSIILHEQPNQGRTIIEKFSDYATVPFAVVLLSGDDIVQEPTSDGVRLRSRARQNVILELGYFLGRLGRHRVFSIYREADDFEIPSDYSGVVFAPFDSSGRWQFDLARELKAAGFRVDANVLL